MNIFPRILFFCLSGFVLSLSVQASPIKDLLLPDGLYLYELERTTRNPVMEEQYLNSGIDTRILVIEKYTGMVVTVKNGLFTDPIVLVPLQLKSDGTVSGPSHPTVNGYWDDSGVLVWEGERDHFGYPLVMFVKARLIPLSPQTRADSRFDGRYELREDLLGRAMVATVQQGLLLLEPVKREEYDDLYGSVPVPVRPDGSFISGLELVTRTVMSYVIDPSTGKTQTMEADSSTYNSIEGKLESDGSITFTYFDSTSSQIDPGEGKGKRVYGGSKVSDGRLENQAVTALPDLEKTDSGYGEATLPLSDYPDWFWNLPKDEGAYYAVGLKKMENRGLALKAAESSAAGQLAREIYSDLRASSVLKSLDKNVFDDSSVSQTSFLNSIPYKIAESVYDSVSGYAFVLVTLSREEALSAALPENRILP